MGRLKLGKTGRHPHGKLTGYDEGEVRLGVTHKRGNVMIDFGVAVKWLGMPPARAREFAALIVKHAEKAEEQAS